MKNTLRLQQIEIENFKNVKYGKVAFDSYIRDGIFLDYYNADILGIYGQNGSGKTSVIDGISILKILLSGGQLDKNTKHLLSYKTNSSAFKYTFTLQIDNDKYIVYYSFKLRYSADSDKIEIFHEELNYSNIDIKNKKIHNPKQIIEFDMNKKGDVFSPVKYYNLIKNQGETIKTDIIVAKELAKHNETSFIFNEKCLKLFKGLFIEENELLYKIIEALHNYAFSTFIIKNDYLEHIDLNALMPFNCILDDKSDLSKEVLKVALFEPQVLDLTSFNVFEKIISQINIVLNSLIPGLALEIKILNKELLKNAQLGNAFELLSVREDVKIPLKYESDGIKKIISILSSLIAMYNNEKICLVVDDLDSSIFEHLFGELLTVLKENAKGQLIFTSHNLRALEVLDKNDIFFTTTNPENRYIKLKNVRKTNNLRDVYLREIFLGEQEEPIYNKTKSYAISRAFRKSGYIDE